MLDKVRQKLNPAGARAEIDDIAARLDDLAAGREELRLSAGRLVVEQARSFEAPRDREIRDFHERIAAADGAIKALRDRRRSLTEISRPASAAQSALITVPMARELASAISALDEARSQRQAILAEARTGDEKVEALTARKLRAQLDEVEARILTLRQARAEHLVPYNVAVNAALAPIIRGAAAQLLSAVRAAREALGVLSEAAQILPPVGPGLANGLAPVAGINRGPLHKAEALALQLLRGEAGSEAVAT